MRRVLVALVCGQKIVELGAGLASDFEHVLKASGGDEGDASAAALKEGVGADGRAADEIEWGFEFELICRGGSEGELDGFGDGFGWGGWAGRDF